MSVSRRQFLQVLGSTTTLYALDPEMALWVPGQRKIFIPPERKLIYAGEIPLSEWNLNMIAAASALNYDSLLYKIVSGPVYIGETKLEYKTIKIYHGYKTGR